VGLPVSDSLYLNNNYVVDGVLFVAHVSYCVHLTK